MSPVLVRADTMRASCANGAIFVSQGRSPGAEPISTILRAEGPLPTTRATTSRLSVRGVADLQPAGFLSLCSTSPALRARANEYRAFSAEILTGKQVSHKKKPRGVNRGASLL